MAFSRGHNNRKSFVFPISALENDTVDETWPALAKKCNPAGRSYLVGIIFEDFVDLTKDQIVDKRPKKKKENSDFIGTSVFAGFRFQKSLMVRTRFPLHEFTLELLNSFVGTFLLNFKIF